MDDSYSTSKVSMVVKVCKATIKMTTTVYRTVKEMHKTKPAKISTIMTFKKT